jgi:hypothetical protein
LKALEKFRMQDEEPVSTHLAKHFKLTKEVCPKTRDHIDYLSEVPYSSTINNLMYVMAYIRLDIAHVVGVVSKYMNNPGKENWKVVKWILRYLRGTKELCFGGLNTIPQGYADSYMVGDIDSRRSTTWYVFTVCGTTISWI